MPQVHQQRVSSNGGIISPEVQFRLDLEKAASSNKVLQNYVPREAGAAFKRPGLEYLGRTKNAGEAVFKPFNYSLDTRLQLEFGEGYLRFWNNRARVHLGVGSPNAWSGTTPQYQVGDPVKQGNVVYFAETAHTPGGGNQPPSAAWNTTNIKVWAASTVYAVGDFGFYFFVDDSKLLVVSCWVCTAGHTSGSSFDQTKWSPWIYRRSWVSGQSMVVGDRIDIGIAGNFRCFRCKVAHNSSSTNKPNTGASWATYWEVAEAQTHSTSSKAYKKGDIVRVGAQSYVSSTDHTSSASNEPGDAGAPWHAVTGIPAWTGASTARAAGDWVLYGCGIFRFLSAYTTGSLLTDGAPIAPVFGVGDSLPAWTSTPVYAQGTVVTYISKLWYNVKEHETAAGLIPGTEEGDDYWQELANIYLWTTGASHTAGQYVQTGSTTYLVLVDHTAGATVAGDVTAGNLVAADYPLELPSPYTLAQALEVNPLQVNDQVWLLHPDVRTRVLERYGNAAWRMTDVEWDMPPMRDENVENDHTMAASATTGTSVTLTSSKAFFEPGMVGGYFKIDHRRENSFVQKSFAASGESPVLRLNGRWDIYIYGTAYKGTTAILFSKDGVNDFQAERTWSQPVANMRTVNATGTTAEEVYAKIKFTRDATGTASDYAVLEAANSRVTGLVKVKQYLSPTQVTVEVIKDLWSTDSTTLWSEGAYSDYRGWPRTGTLHEQRLVLVGSGGPTGVGELDTIRSSRFDGFFDFTVLTSDDGALAFRAASEESNAIMWAKSFGKGLAFGTTADEWYADSGSEGKILTPTNPPRVNKETHAGSAPVQAIIVGDGLLFLNNDRQNITEFSYSFSDNKHVKQSMTQIASHLMKSGVKQWAVQRQPESVLWCVMNDGRLLSFTYDRQQNVVAWAEHITDGSFDSVSVIYGGSLNADEVWFVIKRTINSVNVHYVESFHKETARHRFEGAEDELCYCDSSVLITNDTPQTVINGLSHLEGKSVVVLADGKVLTATVTSGSITLATAATLVRVGLSYESLWQGLWLDAPLQDGSAQDRTQRTAKSTLVCMQTGGMEYHPDPDDSTLQWYPMDVLDRTDIGLRTVKPTKVDIVVGARHTPYHTLMLKSSLPLPSCIMGIIHTNEYFG
jgi:hypothetical protein